MCLRSKSSFFIVLLLMFSQLFVDGAIATPEKSIHGRVVDANTGLGIPNATVLIWNLDTLTKPKFGAGIYLTDENGEYSVSSEYLKLGNTYYMYAFKGNFEAKQIDYVPSSQRKVYIETSKDLEVSFSLLPGALVELEGTPYLAQSSSPEARLLVKVLPRRSINVSFMTDYISGQDVWWLGLNKELVIVPANIPVTLETQAWFFTREVGSVAWGAVTFIIYNGSLPFLLSQGDSVYVQLSTYSLENGLDYVDSKYVEVSSQVERAQGVGFVVFDERQQLKEANQRKIEAYSCLAAAQTDKDYFEVWAFLREAISNLDMITTGLAYKRMIATTGAVYLSSIMSIFSAVLAFFFFEQTKKKLISNIAIYISFLVIMYFLYPGSRIIIDENLTLFLESVIISFLAVVAVVFGVPHVWKERRVESEVSWRSAIVMLFSMGKRQIRCKRIRGVFTILSIVILILAFTSLTSFGTAFGIISKELNATSPSDGILVKRGNATSLLFSPLGIDEPVAVKEIVEIRGLAIRLKNIPSLDPIVRLENLKTGKSWLVYGVLGITPREEATYTHLDQTIRGNYLSETGYNEILLSESVAYELGVQSSQNVTLEIIGTQVSNNFTVTGIISDEQYTNLVDIDGSAFGPVRFLSDGSVRRCNNTEIVIMSFKSAQNLQDKLDASYAEDAPQFVVLADFVFKPAPEADIKSLVRTLIFVFNYDVFASSNKVVTYYYIGFFVELKGAAELVIPLIMVGLNVGMVMMNAVYERRKEIKTLSMVGLNPTHIGLIFVTEAIILGMVGGSLGYLFGLGFYRIMSLFGQQLMVREKLEWWWSAIAFALALASSVLSSIRPAVLAVSTYTPSKVRRIKRTKKESQGRKDDIFKVYQARQLSMPVKIQSNEIEFFLSYFLDRLKELKTGYLERVEAVKIVPEIETIRGELVTEIKFHYIFGITGQKRITKNRIILTKSPKEDYYRISLTSEPGVLGMPESVIERTIDFVHDAIIYWIRIKDRFITGLDSS